MKLTKKLLLSTLALSTIAITVPVILTSCNDNKGDQGDPTSKTVDFVDLTKYSGVGNSELKMYTFTSTTANDTFKDKSEAEVKELLGINNLNGDPISKDAFDKLINGLTFSNVDLTNITNPKSLSYSDIKTSALNNENVISAVTYLDATVTKTVGIAFTLKEGATWVDGSRSTITFSVQISGISIPM